MVSRGRRLRQRGVIRLLRDSICGDIGDAVKLGKDALEVGEDAVKVGRDALEVGEDAEKIDRTVENVGKISEEVGKAIKTPYGKAIQSTSEDALAIKNSVNNGEYVYRAGQFGRSNTTDAQFWAAESPMNPGYAGRYGVYYGQQDYIIRGTIKPGSDFITRPAPASKLNSGGGIEIVTQPDGVNLDSYYMP